MSILEIIGTKQQGSLLSINHTFENTDDLVEFDYQWNRNSLAIEGATSSTYLLRQADVGSKISVDVSYLDLDGTNKRVTSAMTNSILNLNDAPTIEVSTSFTTDEDTTLESLVFNIFDIDGDQFTYSFGDPVSGKVLDNEDGTFQYIPNVNFFGTDFFSLVASDGSLTTEKKINITVNPINDKPEIPPFILRTNENFALEEILPAIDVDGDQLYFGILVEAENGTISLESSAGAFNFSPLDDYSGQDQFIYFVADNEKDFNTISNSDDPFSLNFEQLSADISDEVKVIIYPKTSIEKQSDEIYTDQLSKVLIEGSAAPRATIKIYEGDQLVAQSEASDFGIWSAEIVTTYDQHSYVVKTIFEDNWQGSDLSFEHTAMHKTNAQNTVLASEAIYSMIQHSGSSFSFINSKLGIASAYDPVSGQNFILDLENTENSMVIEGYFASYISSAGELLITSQTALTSIDDDHLLDAYVASHVGDDLSLIDEPSFIIDWFSKSASEIISSTKYDSGFNNGFESIGVGITSEGNNVTLLKGATSSISITDNLGSYENDHNIWSWDGLYLAFPGQNSYSSNGSMVYNSLVSTPHLDVGGNFLSWTEAVGPKNHVGFIADITTNEILDSIGQESDDSFTFHLSASSDGKQFSYIETPSWYGDESNTISYLNSCELKFFDGEQTHLIDTGAISYQEISDDGLYIYYQNLNDETPGNYVYDIKLGSKFLISAFVDREYDSDAKILDQFLANDFPRSIIASRFFYNNERSFDDLISDFVVAYPQLEYDSRVAIGSPSSSVSIGRILDFGDTPQNVPVIIAHRSDLPALDHDQRDNWMFDSREIYKIKNTIADDALSPITFIGNNVLEGIETGDGGDEVYALGGDDLIYTAGGDDLVFAGNGNDTVIGGSGLGDDYYDGGNGIDTIKYTSAEDGILVNLKQGFAHALGGGDTAKIGSDLIYQIENIISGDFADELVDDHYSNSIFGNGGNDLITLSSGSDFADGGTGNDLVHLTGSGTFGSDLIAQNISSNLQTGTNEFLRVDGKTRFEDVMDGGADVDTVELTDASDAFFLHDSFSGFHSSLSLLNDYAGELGTARIENIENINAGGGDDIIDLTSPDYSLAGQNITVDGNEGNDTLWGSDANETLKGGNGDDELFGGAGINELIGGSGADEFQFTETSSNDTVSDFSISDGDTLKFFNTGGAQFDRESIALNSEGDELTIAYGSGVDDTLTITLMDAGLQLDNLTADVLFIV